MNHRTAFSGLRYRGRVRSVRRDYHVLEGRDHFVLFSPKDKAGGNYTLVPRAAVQYIARRLDGTKSIGSGEAFEACKRSKFLPTRFAFLNAMYALIGIGEARIMKLEDQRLFFGVRKKGA